MTRTSNPAKSSGDIRRPGTDSVVRLLRLAGTPSPIDEARKQEAFAAAESEWAALVGKRVRRRRNYPWLAAAAMVTLAILAGGVWYGTRAVPTMSGPVGAIEAFSGTIGVNDPTRDDGLTLGVSLSPGTELTTRDGRLALRLAGGHAVRLDVESHLVLVSPTKLVLKRGALYFDSGVDGSSVDPIEVETPLGSAYDVGTQYAVRVEEGSLRIRVREGHVRIERPGRTYEAPEGTETTIDNAGEVVRSFVPSFGPTWDWTLAIVPTFEIEGKPLREFLEWTSREAGWRLAYNDPRVPARAAEIRMSGSIENLTIEEALDTILPASGLGHRVEAGLLIVTDAGGDEGP